MVGGAIDNLLATGKVLTRPKLRLETSARRRGVALTSVSDTRRREVKMRRSILKLEGKPDNATLAGEEGMEGTSEENGSVERKLPAVG